MASLKISASSLLKNHFLQLDSGGVKFYESSGIGGAKRFQFSEIGCVLMSPDHTLSFQVGQQVFSIPTDPNNARDQAVITALVQELRRTNQSGPPPIPAPGSEASGEGPG